MKHIFKLGLCAFALMLVSLQSNSSSASIVIDYTFDGTADVGPAVQQISNGNGFNFSANTTTGVISTGDGGNNGANNNNTTGFNSSGTVDVSAADGFIATFEISGANANLDPSTLASNGLFFGLVSGADVNNTDGDGLYNNNPDSFGYVAGSNAGDHASFEGVGSADNNSRFASTAPTDASFEDGFTLQIEVLNDDTWTISSTGLIADFNETGSLDTLTYETFASDLGVYVSLQGRSNGSDITLDRITLETVQAIPEPSSAALLGLGGIVLLLRRRK